MPNNLQATITNLILGLLYHPVYVPCKLKSDMNRGLRCQIRSVKDFRSMRHDWIQIDDQSDLIGLTVDYQSNLIGISAIISDLD